MKKILSFLIVCIITCGLYASKVPNRLTLNIAEEVEDTTAADTAVDVVAYFAKGDTCDYRITETKWKINGTDTTQTVSINSYVRLVVTDSTASGYKMTYTFTDFQSDSVPDSSENALLSKLAERLKKDVIGTTIEFETDEMGAITQINNLGQIKKKAKALFKEGVKELADMPEMKALKEAGINVKDFTKSIDVDELVDGYVEELKLLFLCHGKSFAIGEKHDHDEATDEDYESDTYRITSVDDDGNYSVEVEVVSIIPQADLKDMVGVFVAMLKDKSFTEKFNKEFDSQVNVDGTISDRYALKCFNDGWPYEVVKQKFVKIGDIEKVNQTYIGVYHFSEKKP